MARRSQLDQSDEEDSAEPKHNAGYRSGSAWNHSELTGDSERQLEAAAKQGLESPARARLLSKNEEPSPDGSPTLWGRHRLQSHSSNPTMTPRELPLDEPAEMRLSPSRTSPREYKEDSAAEIKPAAGEARTDWDSGERRYPSRYTPEPPRLRVRTSTVEGAVSFIYQARDAGEATDLVQCTILRNKHSAYTLYLQEQGRDDVPLILAQRKPTATHCTFHLFDLTRGRIDASPSKKSGNYIGKLKALDLRKSEYVLKTAEGAELGAICFEKVPVLNQFTEGPVPRKVSVVLPPLDADSVPIPHTPLSTNSSLLKLWQAEQTGRMFVLRSKAPTLDNGKYRLNFGGRVTVTSVKNFQLTSPDSPDVLSCQFGKVGADKFHLDYKAPLNAIQAFAVALCQFHV